MYVYHVENSFKREEITPVNVNLSEIYIEMDDIVPEQKHYTLYFLFENENRTGVYEYALEFDGGMCLEDFKEFVKLFSSVIQHTNPTECREET